MKEILPVKKIKIVEVGPRDGFQNESIIIDTNQKIKVIEKLSQTGLKYIEITAFVSPKWIPTLSDHKKVADSIKRYPGIIYQALVPNIRGYISARDCNIDEVSIIISASETHNKKNINCSTNDAFKRYEQIAYQAKKDNIAFKSYISCAFGCPYEGYIDPNTVINIAVKLLNLGTYEISIGDTIGAANPNQVKDLVSKLLLKIPASKISLHMHDTRGMALVNIYTAIQLGISTFDSSFGGLGGCPYAPGASGNVATEELVNMLHDINLETCIDIKKLCLISLEMQKILGRKLPSKILSLYNDIL